MARGQTPFLHGVRILDLTWVASGPSGTLLLALNGAEVIKIESTHALDDYRRRSLTDHGTPDRSPYFQALNAGKKSVRLNLKSEGGKAVARALVGHCDVLVENFAPGTMERLGLGYSDLARANHDLVMVSASAMGQAGPRRAYAGFAPVFAALGGLSWITGPAGSRPGIFGRSLDGRVGVGVALGVAIGLLYRDMTGEGCHLDLSGQETVASLVGDVLLQAQAGRPGARDGDFRLGAGVTMTLNSSMGETLSIEANTQEQFATLLGLLGIEELRDDKRFADNLARVRHTDELRSVLGAAVAAVEDLPAFIDAANRAGIGVSQVLSPEAVVSLREFIEDDLLPCNEMAIVGNPVGITGAGPAVGLSCAPRLGEHTHQVLTDLLGLNPEEIDRLEAAGVIE